MKILRIILLSLVVTLPLSALTIADKIEHGAPGDYILTKQNQLVSLLRLHTITEDSLIFEEISLPHSEWKKVANLPLNEWLEAGAKGHNSWTLFEIDRDNGDLLECFSHVRNAWMKLDDSSLFLSSLMRLPLQTVPKEKRRKIGPRPRGDQLDTRKIWNPPLQIEGQRVKGSFDAYQISWPKDDSPLSRKKVDLYFAKDCPTFPAWIQISDASDANYRIQTLDMGKNLTTAMKTLPRRSPQIKGPLRMTSDGLTFQLEAPLYFKKISITLLSELRPADAAFTPNFSREMIGEETCQITIFPQDLEDLPKGPYFLQISAKQPEQITLISNESIYWK